MVLLKTFTLVYLTSACYALLPRVTTTKTGLTQPLSASSTPIEVEDRPKNLPPGRPTNRFVRWLFDDSIALLSPKNMKLLNRREKFGPIFKTNFLLRPTIFLADVDKIEEFSQYERRDKDSFNAFFPPHHYKLFGKNSLLVMSGERHTVLRGLIMTSLTPIMTKAYQPLIKESVQAFLEDVHSVTKESYVEMVPKIRSLFTSIMLQVILGTKDVSADLVNDISIWARGLVAPPLTALPFTTAGKAMKARARIIEQLKKLMDDRSSLEETGLLAKLLDARDDNNSQLSQEEIIDNLFTLVFAGSDTTAAAATSVCLTLSKDPEVENVLKESPSKIESFVAQVLEAFPSAPFQMRETTREIEVGDYRIPSNWLVAFGFAAALDDKVAPTPASLKPTDEKPPNSVAFGKGPRRCPGRFLACSELEVFTEALLGVKLELKPDQNLEQQYTPGFFPVDRWTQGQSDLIRCPPIGHQLLCERLMLVGFQMYIKETILIVYQWAS